MIFAEDDSLLNPKAWVSPRWGISKVVRYRCIGAPTQLIGARPTYETHHHLPGWQTPRPLLTSRLAPVGKEHYYRVVVSVIQRNSNRIRLGTGGRQLDAHIVDKRSCFVLT